MKNERGKEAVCVFQKKLSGYVHFSQNSAQEAVKVRYDIRNLNQGKHGFHIHKLGDIRGTNCSNCSEHWNPFNKTHGGRHDKNSHAGDLGNITANKMKRSRGTFTVDKITMFGKRSIIGRSVIVHDGEDDLGKGEDSIYGLEGASLINGNAGRRLDCAVIGISKE